MRFDVLLPIWMGEPWGQRPRLGPMRRAGEIPAQRRAGFSGGRLLMVLAALAGLFAMHGMSDHGTMRHSPTEAVGSHSTSAHGAMAAGGSATVVGVATTATVASIVVDSAVDVAEGASIGDTSESGDLHPAVGLCLAILAGAVFLTLRRTGPSSYPLSSVLAADPHQVVLSALARDPDPPDLHDLSIQRC